MRVLLVGAGSVGQVYGYHFQQGGAEVGFLVRPRYRAEVERGFSLYPLNGKRPREAPVRFEGFEVVTDAATAAESSWDVVVLCVSSTAIRKGEWLVELAGALKGAPTWVTLQPGIKDRAFLLERLPEERLVGGLISLVSYHAPLPGESVPTPGMAYWFPPGPCPFGGPEALCAPIIETLTRGGQRAARKDDLAGPAAFGSAMLMPLVATLELAGWSFQTFRSGPWPRLWKESSGQILSIVARHLGRRPPWWRHLVHSFHVSWISRLAPRVLPYDPERFFQVHFTKVGDQTRASLRTYEELGATYALPTQAIAEVRAGLS
ncbi:MAG: ketopantoate reductase family protein [Planctomycetota bacterium]|jgi:2-dehydropantoate 2-reductase